jgi:hypothetical protein
MLSGTGSGTYDLFAGASNCTGGIDVGNITVACSETFNNGNARVSLSLDQGFSTGIVNHYFLGCGEISKCNPPDFGGGKITGPTSATATGPFNCLTTTTKTCGGIIMFSGQTAKSFDMGCKCDAVRWVFHQGDGSITVPDKDGACPIKT